MDNKQNVKEDPYLSVVAVSRNDNHGGRLTYRMQKFVDGFITQCKRHNVHAELILVEWNPPEDRPFLDKALKYPKTSAPALSGLFKFLQSYTKNIKTLKTFLSFK